MNNKSISHRQAASDRNKGLILAVAASLVLIILALYKEPLFHTEHHGIIIGISEIHNEKGSKLIAAVQLDTGNQVQASMPRELLMSEDINVTVDEGLSLFGRKTYTIITNNE